MKINWFQKIPPTFPIFCLSNLWKVPTVSIGNYLLGTLDSVLCPKLFILTEKAMGMYVYSIVHAKNRENCFMFLKKDLLEISHPHNLVILTKIETKL